MSTDKRDEAGEILHIERDHTGELRVYHAENCDLQSFGPPGRYVPEASLAALREELEKVEMNFGHLRARAINDLHSLDNAKKENNALEARCAKLEKAVGERFTKDFFLEVIGEWKVFWMNQHQNSKEDQQNYFRRALAVDANMEHHLAKLLCKALAEEKKDE